ncbi:CDKN2A-interacting protein isoform X1 [Rana temporaria]|uniref:CDKN2A-interacting protein isoform X1 n=1 Tax=Rana temporaria TaxID=8407 RepID=UPI001AAD8D67|nr:CDKN2A-interacting protein isoform X1 [Rana temporaria]
MEGEVSEFLRQNRETAAWLEGVRGVCESDKLWLCRREFILRNLEDFCGPGQPPPPPDSNHRGLDRLLAYSMVWVNHVFTGCRYPPLVMEKALKMAESIKVSDAPVHTTRDELVSKVKKRGITSSNEGLSEEPLKKRSTDDTSTTEAGCTNLTEDLNSSTNVGWKVDHCQEVQQTDTGPGSCAAPEQCSVSNESNRKMVKDGLQISMSTTTVKPPRRPTDGEIKERQSFFNKLYKRVAWKLVSVGGFNPNHDYTEVLDECIKTLKSTLDIAFVPLKDLAELPQNKTSQENMVCELRCQAVYIGMGCGKTRASAQAVASREAIKLFQKKKLVVKICKRKFSGREVEDLVLLDDECRAPQLPPALQNPQDLL